MTDGAAFCAGSRVVQVQDTANGIVFPLWLLYPTRAPETLIHVGPRGLPLLASPDAAPCEGRFPLVVWSHGGGGSPHVYRSLAAALARQGFIVALPQHHGDNRDDSSLNGSARTLQLRARHVSVAIDTVLVDAALHSHVDANRVAIIGHSMGGATAWILAGAQPWMRDGTAVDVQGLADARVRALVLLAPAAAFFAAPGALQAVELPTLLMVGDQDPVTPLSTAQHALAQLRGRQRLELVVVPGAGHFAFLTPFPPGLRTPALPPAMDPPGFDRDVFQESLNASLLAFLRRALG